MSRGANVSTSPFAMGADPPTMQAWLNNAVEGERYIYCIGERPIGKAAELARTFQEQGVVRLHHVRNGVRLFDYLMVRTAQALPDLNAPEPLDEAAEAILRAMRRAVNFRLPCPSDAELARIAGLATRDQAQWRVRKLVRAGRCQTQQVTEDGVTTRIVTIRFADGSVKSSLPPPKMLAAQRAMKSEQRK